MATEPRADDADKPPNGVTIGDVAGGIHGTVIAGRDVSIGQRITNLFLGSTEQQRAQRNRRAMLELVKNTWIKGVLEQSLHGAVMIELGLEERAEAVEHPWEMLVRLPDRPNRALPPGTKIIDVFEKMGNSLLILGEPGSGKTTMLLELARDLISRAERDPSQPIPVVFNLASWAARSPKTDKARKEKEYSLADWLTAELIDKYKAPQKVALAWMENDDLLLLLDGLDEVKPESQKACAQAINDFRTSHGFVPLVVCSRIADYEALTTKLMLQGAVLLQPFTSQQVDQYFEHVGAELAAVRQVLRYDVELQELARSPLELSVMALAYRGMPITAIASEQAGSIEARRKHLFDAYIQQMFERIGRSKKELYSQGQTKRWLAWLAQKMMEHGQSVFLLERIQHSWLQTPARQRRHKAVRRLVDGLILGLIGGLILGLPLVLTSGQVSGLISWLPFWLLIGLLLGTFLGQSEVEKPTEVLKWSRGTAWRELVLMPIDVSRAGLAVGAFFGLLWGLQSGLPGGLRDGLLMGFGWGVVDGILGLALGLVFGLFFALVRGLVNGLRSAELEVRTIPNQGIQQSMKNALITWLASGLVFGLVGGLTLGLFVGLVFGLGRGLRGLAMGMAFGLAEGMIAGEHYGGRAVVYHYTLRLMLCRSGYMPWNYVRFLDYAAERIFLRKVGGGYIFVHRLLMEHFASLEPE